MTWTYKNIDASKNVYDQLPTHLKFVIDKARSELVLNKVVLFGSRARGDARDNSDFDLAFSVSDQKNWVKFALSVEEGVPSLYNYDLVNFEKADPELKKSIQKEGIVIYEN